MDLVQSSERILRRGDTISEGRGEAQRSETHQEVDVLLICMPLKLDRELIEVVNPDLRLVHSRRHGVVTVRRRLDLERRLGELPLLDQLQRALVSSKPSFLDVDLVEDGPRRDPGSARPWCASLPSCSLCAE